MWPLDLALHLQSKAQMKQLDANHSHYIASVQSKMERSDFATSRVKKNHREITSVQSRIYV